MNGRSVELWDVQGDPTGESWAAKWLSGEDRSLKTAVAAHAPFGQDRYSPEFASEAAIWSKCGAGFADRAVDAATWSAIWTEQSSREFEEHEQYDTLLKLIKEMSDENWYE